MSKPRILLIDDDEALLGSLRDLLEAFDYEVYLATNGPAGLSQAQETKPDLVILDVMMRTDTEGLEIARRLRSLPELRATRIMLVTGMLKTLGIAGSSLTIDPQWLPVDLILEKPVEPDMLIKEIRRLLKNKHSGDKK
ncbi:MAG: response regulator [Lentisphaerae bacterium]|nr:response regulator [Lentisphaerota bacterium]